MTRNELSPDGSEWTIPSHRYKGQDGKGAHAHLIPLSPQARAVLAKVPKENCDYIFTSNGRTPISGFSKFKRALDQRLMAALKEEGGTTCKRIIADLNERYPGKGYEPFDGKWQTHSLRKTARTLLSRCKIDERIAEKCLGHRDGGLVGTYNHHEAKPEKRMAFEALGREVDRIIDGGPAKVLPMRKPRA